MIQPEFDQALKFKNNLAVAKKSKIKGYINKTGKYIWKLIN